MIMHDKCEPIWKDASGTLSGTKKNIKFPYSMNTTM